MKNRQDRKRIEKTYRDGTRTTHAKRRTKDRKARRRVKYARG